ncbi:Uncharacterised protein r2_g310 [Pycnogonum litorale]
MMTKLAFLAFLFAKDVILLAEAEPEDKDILCSCSSKGLDFVQGDHLISCHENVTKSRHFDETVCECGPTDKVKPYGNTCLDMVAEPLKKLKGVATTIKYYLWNSMYWKPPREYCPEYCECWFGTTQRKSETKPPIVDRKKKRN